MANGRAPFPIRLQGGGDVMSLAQAYDPYHKGSLLDVGEHADQDNGNFRVTAPAGIVHFPNKEWTGEGSTSIVEADGTFYVVPGGATGQAIERFQNSGEHYGGFQTQEQAMQYETYLGNLTNAK